MLRPRQSKVHDKLKYTLANVTDPMNIGSYKCSDSEEKKDEIWYSKFKKLSCKQNSISTKKKKNKRCYISKSLSASESAMALTFSHLVWSWRVIDVSMTCAECCSKW